ncbi:MAG: DNA topoisomerase IV subunit B [Acetobacterales bacterium]
MSDLFEEAALPAGRKGRDSGYTAKDIEVLEGLEPVRRRPGMYIGGTDERAMHHLVAEVLDNAMDEAVAGHASWIDLELGEDGTVTVRDNGRGIPVDAHPKIKDKPAVEVILTTLHSGGKFGGDAYETSGGLHGVGVSVVNALAEHLRVEIARDQRLWTQEYARGKPTGKLKDAGEIRNRRGTSVSFRPDMTIFDKDAKFRPARLYRMARSKAYLYRGVEIRWRCAEGLIGDDTPAVATLHFPGGLADFLTEAVSGEDLLTPSPFRGEAKFPDGRGRLEWAVTWTDGADGFLNSYCNTIPTPEGGTHEAGLRNVLTKGLRAYGELTSNKRSARITGDDVLAGAAGMLSVFLREPQFQGQTKERLATTDATRLVENAVRDHLDHWLSGDPKMADALLERIVDRAEERLRRKQQKETQRKTATRRLRLPGKLSDCSRGTAEGTELFLVEGDSAGGSAKQARARETQAVLPLRGKILNVASASSDKLMANQELSDLIEALGCGTRSSFDEAKLRYERVVIMTDADVDGAHIASLLMTFFFRELPGLVRSGHLFLAVPPLYRLSQGGKVLFARDDAHREQLLKSVFDGRGKVEISRFKGLGEMPPGQLRETTMAPGKRVLLRVTLPGPEDINGGAVEDPAVLVEALMGRKPELRLAFIQDRARFVDSLDV